MLWDEINFTLCNIQIWAHTNDLIKQTNNLVKLNNDDLIPDVNICMLAVTVIRNALETS